VIGKFNAKQSKYAYAGIPEVWLVDLQENKIIVYTEPVGESYRQSRQYFPGEKVGCSTIENLEIAVSDVIWVE
jgi:Uma2 family endonuclease